VNPPRCEGADLDLNLPVCYITDKAVITQSKYPEMRKAWREIGDQVHANLEEKKRQQETVENATQASTPPQQEEADTRETGT